MGKDNSIQFSMVNLKMKRKQAKKIDLPEQRI